MISVYGVERSLELCTPLRQWQFSYNSLPLVAVGDSTKKMRHSFHDYTTLWPSMFCTPSIQVFVHHLDWFSDFEIYVNTSFYSYFLPSNWTLEYGILRVAHTGNIHEPSIWGVECTSDDCMVAAYYEGVSFYSIIFLLHKKWCGVSGVRWCLYNLKWMVVLVMYTEYTENTTHGMVPRTDTL